MSDEYDSDDTAGSLNEFIADDDDDGGLEVR